MQIQFYLAFWKLASRPLAPDLPVAEVVVVVVVVVVMVLVVVVVEVEVVDDGTDTGFAITSMS
jgi:hypothetical protein